MAVTNFIQSIWSKKIQDDLELKCKLVNNCLRDYEGDVKHAQSVKILGVGEPTIGAYDGSKDINIEGADVDAATLEKLLVVDKARWAAEAEEITAYYAENFGDKMPVEIMDNLAILKANCAK